MQDEQSKDADKECGRPRQTSLPRVVVGLALVVGLVVASPAAQPVFRGTEIFPPEEYAARRAKVMAQIGDGVAIVLGTTEPPGEMPFRQNSQFFYLTGVAEPRARVIIDGRTKKTTVFLQPKNDGATAACTARRWRRDDETREGARRGRGGAATPSSPRRSTSLATERRTIYTPFAAEVLGSQSQGDPHAVLGCEQGRSVGRPRLARSGVHRQAEGGRAAVGDQGPRSRRQRAARDQEPARDRRHPRGHADRRLGIVEAMRDARPGMHEYELQADAEFVFKKHGALGAGRTSR